MGTFRNHIRKTDKKEIYGLPETWFTARMRQFAAREALSMVLSAKNLKNRKKSNIRLELGELTGEEIFDEPAKPVHNGKKGW